jgi:hypothetical protein
MAKSHLKLVAPATEKRTVVTPVRKPNAELRTREYLTDAEVESRNRLSRRGSDPRLSRGPTSRRRRERDRDPCLAKSIRHHTGAAGSDASDSIRACCLSSAQNSEGILPCSEL